LAVAVILVLAAIGFIPMVERLRRYRWLLLLGACAAAISGVLKMFGIMR
jgi:hypothetical protein